MIKENRKFSIQDASGRNRGLDIEVNWNYNKSVRDCEHLKISMGDEEAIVSRDQLWHLVFMLSKDEQQEKMLPYAETLVRHHQTVINVQAKNDIKKGQIYGIPITISQDSNGKLLVKP